MKDKWRSPPPTTDTYTYIITRLNYNMYSAEAIIDMYTHHQSKLKPLLEIEIYPEYIYIPSMYTIHHKKEPD